MWILPNGRVAPSSVWHYQWLLSNRALAKRLGVPLDQLPEEEDPIRLAALRVGFVRLNYEHKTGTLTIEANRLRFDGRVRNAIRGVVLENLKDVYIINFNLLSVPQRGRPSLWGAESVALFKHSVGERPALIPYVADWEPLPLPHRRSSTKTAAGQTRSAQGRAASTPPVRSGPPGPSPKTSLRVPRKPRLYE
jgi:hypothetical protein